VAIVAVTMTLLLPLPAVAPLLLVVLLSEELARVSHLADRAALETIGESHDPELAGRNAGLFKMQFMQRSIAAQQEQAKAEKEALLQESAGLDIFECTQA
jgi:hypothetical protein